MGPEFSMAEGEAQGLGGYKKEAEERGWKGIQKGLLCPKSQVSTSVGLFAWGGG